MHFRRFLWAFWLGLTLLGSLGHPSRADQNFESPPVHPLELSSDGDALFVAHTVDHRLVVFDLSSGEPERTEEIQVGLEPVSVRQRTATEVWVVNHVSDSISIVDLLTGRVVKTLLVGDEPTDVVFAGTPQRAFVCVSQEDRIRVYDPNNLAAAPVNIPLDMSDPISLAVSNDGGTVYVCALDSQNRTTAIPFTSVQAGGGPPPSNPPMDPSLPAPPRTALIVRHDGTAWRDEIGRNWNAFANYTLLDRDVITISATSLNVSGFHRGVGTTLFQIAVNPVDGRLYVSNQEATNEVRFEPNLSGNFLRNRVTVISGSGTVTPVHLNPHINYANEDGTPSERANSLSIPLGMAVAPNGQTVYVAAFGSGKVGVLDANANVTRRIDVGGGPAALALDDARGQLYVLDRIESRLVSVDLSDDSWAEFALGYDPTPPEVALGRALFYDGEGSSAHGDVSCASCHVFGGMDNISWDLGDPLGDFIPPPQQFGNGFHPMKGPMATQSLKGLETLAPLHWRGDRPDLGAFNPAFVALLGRSNELTASEFADLEAFLFSLSYPPNPLRNLDGSLPNPGSGPNPAHGEQLFLTGRLVGSVNCVDCHSLPAGRNNLIIPAQLLQEDQDMVVPQLRNMYEKTRFNNQATTNVRGFGYTHDGAIDDLFTFLDFPAFTFDNDDDQRDVESFLLHFDTGTPTAVGAQWTMDGTNSPQGLPRVQTLMTLADAGIIGMVAKGRDSSAQMRGYAYVFPEWVPDRASEPTLDLGDLLDLAAIGTEVTFTAVPVGCEMRLGVDRDLDGFFDRDELDAGSDPGDPESTPGTTTIASGPESGWRVVLEPMAPNPAQEMGRLRYRVAESAYAELDVIDVSGRLVRRLFSGQHASGDFEREWNLTDERGEHAPSGVYFVRLRTKSGTGVSRSIVVQR